MEYGVQRDSSTEFLSRTYDDVVSLPKPLLMLARCVDSGLAASNTGSSRCCDCRSRFVRSATHTEYVSVMRLESPAPAIPYLRVRHR